ncbi:DUF3788 domain-containing protein [Bacillus sp. CLL-7-23]|uniref:DUF3788 domain-containing protein n=1 Tax=Bacillus changyiensis TaxID=3004103 RepID=A0ABT4X813_9BACI|nr:DUF3788 domain-containing protein [Bacillus changyiensis]MDA7027884.1 DUF3788 domain-containing protein [Bacillus changyiensis]
MWDQVFDESCQPTFEDITSYVNHDLWDECHRFIDNHYKISPKLEYSKCSLQKGWNVKYKKSGKSLCTLYPMKGYFIVLVVIGTKEKHEADMIVQTCTPYIQELYKKTPSSHLGQWLMIEVKNRSVLEDVFQLIQIRVKKS